MIKIEAEYSDDAQAINILKVTLPNGSVHAMTALHFPEFAAGANRLIMTAKMVEDCAKDDHKLCRAGGVRR